MRDVTNASGLDVVEEIRKRRALAGCLASGAQQIEGPDGKNDDECARDHPEEAGAWQFSSEHGYPSTAARTLCVRVEEPTAAGYTGCNRPDLFVGERRRGDPDALDDCIGRLPNCKQWRTLNLFSSAGLRPRSFRSRQTVRYGSAVPAGNTSTAAAVLFDVARCPARHAQLRYRDARRRPGRLRAISCRNEKVRRSHRRSRATRRGATEVGSQPDLYNRTSCLHPPISR